MQEYGRLVKIIFILRYLLNQPLRRKINTQLNKGEQLHALRSWLWFGATGCCAANRKKPSRRSSA